ncbi:MAG: MFS transporter small subunit [Janthinobacterium lividum]
MAENYSNSSLGVLVFRWLVVGLPLAWGIIETLKKSLALFH